MTHSLPTHFGLDDLHATFLTNNPSMLHPFVLAAIALIIFGGAENFGAKKSIFFRFKGPVVYRLRFLPLPIRPRLNLLRRGNGDTNGVKTDRALSFLKE